MPVRCEYVENEALTKDVKGKANLAGKPVLQDKVRKALAKLFGDSPQQIRVPAGSGLPAGGFTWRTYMQEGEGAQAKLYRLYQDPDVNVPDESRHDRHCRTRVRRPAATRSTAATACTATAFRAPATGRRPRSCIRRPAIIARGSSSSPRRPAASLPPQTICAARSRTACTARRCRRSTR